MSKRRVYFSDACVIEASKGVRKHRVLLAKKDGVKAYYTVKAYLDAVARGEVRA